MAGRVNGPLSPKFNETTIRLRGVDYTLRELSIEEYENLVEKATVKRENQFGSEVEEIDQTVLLKLMRDKCLVEPRLKPSEQSALPARVIFKLNAAVREMHYGDEPEEKVEKAEEVEEKGNA